MKARTILLAMLLPVTAVTAQTLTDSSLTLTQIVSGLDQPIGIEFLSASDLLILEKANGQVRRVISGVLQASPVLDLAVDSSDERGILSILKHPGFATNNFIYICSTPNGTLLDSIGTDPTCICVERYDWNGSVLTNPSPIFSFSVAPGVDYHNGGVMTFGPDGKLYIVTGDHEQFGPLQNQDFGFADDTSVIVRLNDDGSVPNDNPLAAEGGEYVKYYAYGVRNSFGLTFDPVTGNLWDTENGEDDYDEINLVAPGFNSGWRRIMGPLSRNALTTNSLFHAAGSQYADPKFSWLATVAPTGIAFLNSTALGAAYENDMFVGDFNNGLIYHFDLNGARDTLVLSGGLSDKVADSDSERDSPAIGTGFNAGFFESGISALKVGPDGKLYVVSLVQGTVFAIYAAGGGGEDHNLLVVSIKPPKKVTLSETKPSQTKPVKVQIQNLSSHTETIDANAFTNVAPLVIESLDICPIPTMTLLPPKKGFPILLAPKKKLTLVYNVTFDCANDPAATTKDAFHSDFRYTVMANHAAINGQADTEPENDNCPRQPSGDDKGCGGKDPVSKQLGADVLTDVVLK